MKQVLNDLNIDTKKYDPRAILSVISNAKNDLLDPKDYAQQANGPFEEIVSKAYFEYQNQLANNQAMDFDDLIMNIKILTKLNMN